MFSILISEKGGETKRLEFDRPEITIGRVAGNDIVLPKGNVSKRHSRIVFKDGKFIIVDLKSTNGTYVNGRKITAPLVIKGADKIYIGDFIMNIEEGTGPSTSSTADLDGAGKAPPPPPPPTRPGTRPAIATMPAIRAEATSMDVAAGLDDDADEPAASAKSPVAEPRQTRPTPPPPPPPRPLTRPPLSALPSEGLARATRDLEGAGALDRPVMSADRISDKATMMAGEGVASRIPPLSGPAASAPAATAPAAAPTQIPTPMPASAPPSAVPSATAPPSVSTAPPPVQAPPAPSPISGRPPISRPSTGAAPVAPRPLTRPSSAALPATGRSSLASNPAAGIEDPQRRRHIEALNQVINKVLDQLNLQNAAPEQLSEATPRIEKLCKELSEKVFPLPMGLETDGLAREAIADLLGSGPLDDFLADETVHEVAVTGHDRVYVDRGTGQSLHDRVFSSAAAVQRAISRLVSRAGGSPDATLLEIRIEGGALLQAALPPHARVPSLVLRRVRKTGGRLQDLVNQGVLSASMSEFLEVCMRERRNLLVSGYGRGVVLGALGGATSAGARVVTVEPVSELDLSGTHAAWISLLGRGQDTRNLLGHAVRMHPDHLMITDVRGPEALDVAAALCGGQGVVVGVDAASTRESIGRLESLARLSNESPSRRALREELAQGVNLAVHVGRTAAGAYRVMEIAEVTLSEEGGGIELIPVFTFKPEGGDGQFVATGHVPAFAG
jgi:pilus assembly protein CpaF